MTCGLFGSTAMDGAEYIRAGFLSSLVAWTACSTRGGSAACPTEAGGISVRVSKAIVTPARA
jgi:hypothetical protein